jgi:hypothetical protein
VDSDDEDVQDENVHPKRGLVLVQDSSFVEPRPHQEVSRLDGELSADGDTDKENDNYDKENQAALAHWPRRTNGVLGPSLNPSPIRSHRLNSDTDSSSQSQTPSRSPLKVISEADEPSQPHSARSEQTDTGGTVRAALSFSERLQQPPSPSPMRASGSSLNLAPVPIFLVNGQKGFSQFDDDEGSFGTMKGATPLKPAFGDELQSQGNATPKPLLKFGFSELFNAESQVRTVIDDIL